MGREPGLSTGFSSLGLLVPELMQLLLHIFLTFPFQRTVETSTLTAALRSALAPVAGGENRGYTILLEVTDRGG